MNDRRLLDCVLSILLGHIVGMSKRVDFIDESLGQFPEVPAASPCHTDLGRIGEIIHGQCRDRISELRQTSKACSWV
jgi:hypothetical protein